MAVHSPHPTPAQRTWYSYRVMVESVDAFHVSLTLPLPAVAASPDGAAGRGAAGVAFTYQGSASGAAVPAPDTFTARRWNRYSVPLVSP